MSLEKLFERIELSEDKIRAEILEKAYMDAKNIKAIAEQNLKAKTDELWKDAKQKEERMHKQSEMKLELERRKKILEAKRQKIDEIYAQTIEEFNKISDDDYINWLAKNINEIDLKDDGKLIIGTIAKKNLDEKKLKHAISNKNISIEISNDLEPGFVYKLKDIEINGLLSVIIHDLKEQEELEISKILFNF